MSVASRVRGACAALTLCSAIGMSPPTTAAEMPAYMGIMVAGPPFTSEIEAPAVVRLGL